MVFDDDFSGHIELSSLDDAGFRVVYCSITLGIERKPPKKKKSTPRRAAG